MSDKRRTPAEALAPVELVDRMTAVTIELGQVIARETEALRSRNRQEVESLQAEKTRLANEYALDVRSVQTRKELIDRAPAERVARLKAGMIELDRLLLLNGEALAAARSVSEGLIRMVANAMSEKAAPALGYGANAAAPRRTATAAGSGSLTLDARV
jgi:flagellar biosynthesis/type III secretory pathway chaperone